MSNSVLESYIHAFYENKKTILETVFQNIFSIDENLCSKTSNIFLFFSKCLYLILAGQQSETGSEITSEASIAPLNPFFVLSKYVKKKLKNLYKQLA